MHGSLLLIELLNLEAQVQQCGQYRDNDYWRASYIKDFEFFWLLFCAALLYLFSNCLESHDLCLTGTTVPQNRKTHHRPLMGLGPDFPSSAFVFVCCLE